MSTEGLSKEIEAARAALGQLDSAGRRELETVRRKRKGLQNERQRVVRGAKVAMRGIDDEDDVLIHVEDQLAPIYDEPEREPVQPPVDEEPNVAPPTPPEPEPTPALVVDVLPEPETPVVLVVEPPASPVDDTWNAADEGSAPVVVVPPERNLANPRNWHVSCWWVALLGAFIGFVVGMSTHEVVTDEVSVYKWVPGLVWVGALIGIGCYGFGLACAYMHDWWLRRND